MPPRLPKDLTRRQIRGDRDRQVSVPPLMKDAPVGSGRELGSHPIGRRELLAGGLAVTAGAQLAWPALAGAVGRGQPVRHYGPTLTSLGDHPLPQWWRDAKFGVFIHWGVYSVPAWAPTNWLLNLAEWYWRFQSMAGTPYWLHHLETYGTNVVYDDFIPQFRAQRYDPSGWADLFRDAGARYFILTTKHHDGFALFPSAVSRRNSAAMGPRRDLVGPLVKAARKRDLKVGLYFSVPEWFNPSPHLPLTAGRVTSGLGGGTDNLVSQAIGVAAFNEGGPTNAYTQLPVPYRGYRPFPDFGEFERAQLRELIRRYRPDEIWADIGGPEPYFHGNQLIAEYYNQAETHNPEGVVVNDRFGDYRTHRDYSVIEIGGSYSLGDYTGGPSETVRTMGESWGFNRSEHDYAPVGTLVRELVNAVANNSNYVLNIGPRADGTIPEPMVSRLKGIGDWLAINGEAIYGTRPWTHPGAGSVRFTAGAKGVRYLIALDWPGRELVVEAPSPIADGSRISLLGSDGRPLHWKRSGSRVTITMPGGGNADRATKSRHAYAFRVGPH
jgi:alpha-L-fucosidase